MTVQVTLQDGRLKAYVEGACREAFLGRKVKIHGRDGKAGEMSL